MVDTVLEEAFFLHLHVPYKNKSTSLSAKLLLPSHWGQSIIN